MTSKINKALDEFIKKEFLSFFTNEFNEHLNLEFNEEKISEIIKHMTTKYDEKYIIATKKRSPRTPKDVKKDEDDDEEVYLDFDDFMKKLDNNPDCLPCGWVYGRGPHKDKFCARNVRDPSDWSEEDRTNFVQRCPKCIRNNDKKESIERNTKKVMSFKIGSQVKGTPTPGASLPDTENDLPVQTMTGLSDSVVSPTPENYLSGKDTGTTTPTKAKSKRKSPEKFKIKKIKHGVHDDFTDYRSSSKVNGKYFLVRSDTSSGSFTFGGKFMEDDYDEELYLQLVAELDEDDIEKVKDYTYEYKYCGGYKKKSPEIPEIPDMDEDEDDDGDDVDDLLEGLNVN